MAKSDLNNRWKNSCLLPWMNGENDGQKSWTPTVAVDEKKRSVVDDEKWSVVDEKKWSVVVENKYWSNCFRRPLKKYLKMYLLWMRKEEEVVMGCCYRFRSWMDEDEKDEDGEEEEGRMLPRMRLPGS